MQDCSRAKNLLNMHHFFLISCQNKIYFIYLCLFEHSCLFAGDKKVVFWNVSSMERWRVVEGDDIDFITEIDSNKILNFQESTTILNACTKKSGNLLKAPRNSWLDSPDAIQYFKTRGLRRIPAPPMTALTELFHTHPGTSIQPLTVSWFVILVHANVIMAFVAFCKASP